MSPKIAKSQYEPGTYAPVSGQYAAYTNDGRALGREATVTKHKRLPAIGGGGFWMLADQTKHAGDAEPLEPIEPENFEDREGDAHAER